MGHTRAERVNGSHAMTDKIALLLGALILGGLGWDYLSNDMNASFFLARKTVDLIEWLAFWR